MLIINTILVTVVLIHLPRQSRAELSLGLTEEESGPRELRPRETEVEKSLLNALCKRKRWY